MWFPKKKIWLVALLAAALLAVALVRQAGQTPHPAPAAEAPAAEAPAEQGAAISPQEPAAPAPEAEGTASGPQEAGGAAAPAEKEAAAADQAADAADAGAAPGEEVVRGTLEKGDTVGKLLADAGSDGVQEYVSAASSVFSMRAFREGQPYVIVTDAATGRVKRFEYEIDSRRRLVVEGLEEPAARVEAIEYVTLLSTVTATISDNLFQAVADVGESPQMALKMAELLARRSTLSAICSRGTVLPSWWKNATARAITKATAAFWQHISPIRAPPTRPICFATATIRRSITTQGRKSA
jgi:hypothetical protein